MAQKLAFQLTEGEAPNLYLIRLLDEKQIAALSLGEGFKKPIKLEPIPLLYDEGNGEVVPLDGFDASTSRGRIVMQVLNNVYCDVVDQIAARKACHDPLQKAELGAPFLVISNSF